MKLSTREKNLIHIFCLCLLTALLLKFMLVPTGNKVLQLEEELSIKQSDAAEFEAQIKAIPQYGEDIRTTDRAIALASSNFKKPMTNEQIDSLMQGFMERYDLSGAVSEIGGVTMSAMGEMPMYDYGMARPTSEEDETVLPSAVIYGSTVTVSGTGSFENIAAFADAFSKETSVRMTSIEMDYIYQNFTATFEIYIYP